MSFVHGHVRRTGWVVAHRRAPHRSEAGQLALLPGPRPPPSGERCGTAAGPDTARGAVRRDRADRSGERCRAVPEARRALVE